jgi:hypothetical protein
MDTVPVIDFSSVAELALTRLLASCREVGISPDGRRLVVVAVDDWIVDWFGAPRRRNVGSRERC